MRAKLIYLAAATWLLAAATCATADSLRVAAAANLQTILTSALIPAFQAQTGVTVVPTFGATKLLATQLEHGAPVDIFIAADTATVDRLAAKGLVDKKTETVYAIGRLVLWSRADAASHPSRVEDLADPKYAHIAIANPATAPYGQAAIESIAKAGLTAAVQPRLVQAENIAQSLQYARSGNADVCFTALSLVIDDHTDPYVMVPDSYHAPIAQALAVVSSDPNAPLADRFVTFLKSPQAVTIWKQYGYELPN